MKRNYETQIATPEKLVGLDKMHKESKTHPSDNNRLFLSTSYEAFILCTCNDLDKDKFYHLLLMQKT